jgi:hypothetical protein
MHRGGMDAYSFVTVPATADAQLSFPRGADLDDNVRIKPQALASANLAIRVAARRRRRLGGEC